MKEIIEKKTIPELYDAGVDIFSLARRYNTSPEFVLHAICNARRLARYNANNFCNTCRWKPCTGAASCYRRTIDGEKAV